MHVGRTMHVRRCSVAGSRMHIRCAHFPARCYRVRLAAGGTTLLVRTSAPASKKDAKDSASEAPLGAYSAASLEG